MGLEHEASGPGRGVGPGPLAPTPIAGFPGKPNRDLSAVPAPIDAASAHLSRTLPSRQDLATVVERPRLGPAVGSGAGCAGSPPTSLHHVAGRHRCVPWPLSWRCLRSTFLPRSWASGADSSLLGTAEALDPHGEMATVIVTLSPWRSAPDGAMPRTVPGSPLDGAVSTVTCNPSLSSAVRTMSSGWPR